MKKELVLVTAIAIATPLVAADRSFNLTGFSRVDAGTGIDVTVVVGGAHAVKAEVSRNGLFRKLKIAQEGDTLVIRRSTGASFFMMGMLDRYAVTVHLPDLEGISAKSGSDINAIGPITGAFDVTTSSGSDVEITGLASELVTLNSSSGSNITVSGTCAKLDVRASSGSDIDANGLLCDDVHAVAKSGSDVTVFAHNNLWAETKSGADIDVYGAPNVLSQSEKSGGDIDVIN